MDKPFLPWPYCCCSVPFLLKDGQHSNFCVLLTFLTSSILLVSQSSWHISQITSYKLDVEPHYMFSPWDGFLEKLGIFSDVLTITCTSRGSHNAIMSLSRTGLKKWKSCMHSYMRERGTRPCTSSSSSSSTTSQLLFGRWFIERWSTTDGQNLYIFSSLTVAKQGCRLDVGRRYIFWQIDTALEKAPSPPSSRTTTKLGLSLALQVEATVVSSPNCHELTTSTKSRSRRPELAVRSVLCSSSMVPNRPPTFREYHPAHL